MERLINGIKMVYRDRGEGIPMLLVHGFPLNSTIWDEVGDMLEGEARVITPDLRGFGDTEVPADQWSLATMAEDLRALLDALGIQRVFLAGHSMGGYISLAFAQAYPERLGALAMISSKAEADPPERAAARRQLAEELLAKGIDPLVAFQPEILTDDESVRNRVRDIIRANDPRGMAAASVAMSRRPDMSEVVAGLRVPVLALAGQLDQLIRPDVSHHIAELQPRARYVEVLQTGHMPMMDKPHQVAEALRSLLQQVREEQTMPPEDQA